MEPSTGLTFLPDPITQFRQWLELREQHEINDPNAMSLATVTAGGSPRVRIVLLKGIGPDGFQFFTNLESDKATEIAVNPNVALAFHWKSLQRQVRITGTVSKLPSADDDGYFATRYRISQVGAWASAQSRPLKNMSELSSRLEEMNKKFEGMDVPRPPHWGGFNIKPQTIEFWAERPYRLHERMLYTLDQNGWQQQRLYP